MYGIGEEDGFVFSYGSGPGRPQACPRHGHRPAPGTATSGQGEDSKY